jgi:hypothetical protein
VDGQPVNPRDDGAGRNDRDKPCCRRFAPGRWCTRIDGHTGECDGPPATEHPKPNFDPRRTP